MKDRGRMVKMFTSVKICQLVQKDIDVCMHTIGTELIGAIMSGHLKVQAAGGVQLHVRVQEVPRFHLVWPKTVRLQQRVQLIMSVFQYFSCG